MTSIYLSHYQSWVQDMPLRKRSLKSWVGCGLALLGWAVTGCGPDMYSPFNGPNRDGIADLGGIADLAGPPPLSYVIWNLASETKGSLQGKGWVFEDCWQLPYPMTTLLSHSRFPIDFMSAGATCSLTLPAYADANATRLEVTVKHTLGKLPLGGDSYVGIAFQRDRGGGTPQDEILLQLQSPPPDGQSVQLLRLSPGESVRLKLLLHAGRDVKVEAGSWAISQIELRSRSN